jgi:hypothetical protein
VRKRGISFEKSRKTKIVLWKMPYRPVDLSAAVGRKPLRGKGFREGPAVKKKRKIIIYR